MIKNIKYCFRWYWNSIRYKLGFTELSPQGHEFKKIMNDLGFK